MKRSLLLLSLFFLSVSISCNVVNDITGGGDNTDEIVNLYPVLIDGDWGYINKKGAIVIEPTLQNAYEFSNGLARVRDSWQWKYMNKNGEFVIEEDFQDIRSFSEGRAAVRLNGRWGYINKENLW